MDNDGMSDTHTDFVQDNNPSIFVHLDDKGLIPQYVMKSARVTEEECKELNDVAFADQAHRLFPCHTKEACWQSAAYFAGRNMQDNTVKEQIVKMANAHGIADDVEKIFESFEGEFAQLKQKEEPTRKYAFVVDYEGFQGRGLEGYYPVNNYAEIVKSAEALDLDYQTNRIGLTMMRKVAANLMEAAEETGVMPEDIPVNVRSLGERRLPDPYAAQHIVLCRKQASAPIAQYNEILTALCENMEKAAGHEDSIAMAEEAASKIMDLDLQNGIAYTPTMYNPYQIIFTGPLVSDMQKAAAQQILIESVMLPVADFLNIPEQVIKTAFSAADRKIIKEAQESVSGASSVEKCANAHEKLQHLSPGAALVLLSTAAEAGW